MYKNRELKLDKLFVILKLTTFCNFACRYCSEPEYNRRLQVDNAILDRVIKVLGDIKPKKLQILLTGGELFSLTTERLDEILGSLSNLHNKFTNVEFYAQTNGSLINYKICELIKKYNLHLGVSMDFPRENHNISRTYHNGKGSWKDVTKALDILQKKNIHYGLLSVLSSKSSNGLYKAYKELKNANTNHKKAKIINFTASGRGINNKIYYDLSPKSLGKLYIQLFDIWAKDKSNFELNPFTSMIKSLIYGNADLCAFSSDICSHIFAISHDGTILPCSRFEKLGFTSWGNIKDNHATTNIISLLNFKRYRKKYLQKNSRCSECAYFKICNGGCGLESYAKNGNFCSPTPNCTANKMIFSHIHNTLVRGYS